MCTPFYAPSEYTTMIIPSQLKKFDFVEDVTIKSAQNSKPTQSNLHVFQVEL